LEELLQRDTVTSCQPWKMQESASPISMQCLSLWGWKVGVTCSAAYPSYCACELNGFVSFLHICMGDGSKYNKGINKSQWTVLLLHATHAQQSTPRCVKNLWKWAKALIIDCKALPCSRNGTAHNCRIDDEDVAAKIATHLQGLGLWICTLDIMHCTTNSEVWVRLKIKKTVSLATAHCWLVKMGYQWTKKLSGQYVDSHEHDDVVHYRQHVFLPTCADTSGIPIFKCTLNFILNVLTILKVLMLFKCEPIF
jgi:hypothetical protein